ncbi:MAG: permease-like cell division protein FtsX [Cyclobacteriaceae bacterium]|jgi:cell division transport system permease protein|nr:permease-like cell division protein FtsX [Cyclobacteriaceae bacterium]
MHNSNAKKKLGSYPSIGVIASITLALFVSGIFGILIIYSQQLERMVRDQVRVQIYLRNGLTDTQLLQVERSIESMPFINKKDSLKFVSRDEAAEQFIAETGEDFKELLGENPLHDAYLVSIEPDYHSPAKMVTVKQEIEKIGGVYQVFYVEGLIESINKNVTRISLVLGGIIAILLTAVVLLINNTIRLALFSQRFLIRSMQLVGARWWFIQSPFIWRASIYGIIAGILASGSLWILIRYANQKIEDLEALMNMNQFMILGFVLISLGVFVAILSTLLSIQRYLRMSLDELY